MNSVQKKLVYVVRCRRAVRRSPHCHVRSRSLEEDSERDFDRGSLKLSKLSKLCKADNTKGYDPGIIPIFGVHAM